MKASWRLLVVVSGLCFILAAGWGIRSKVLSQRDGPNPGANSGPAPGAAAGPPAGQPPTPPGEVPAVRSAQPASPTGALPDPAPGPAPTPVPAAAQPPPDLMQPAPRTAAAGNPPPAADPDDAAARLFAEPVDLRDPAKRAELVAKLRALEDRKMTQVREKARRLGIPLEIVQPGGRKLFLVAFDGDQPRYESTQNQNAALSTGADLVRSTAPYLANGAGFAFGLWESGGIPLAAHREFGSPSKVAVVDGSSTVTAHATHVAGTLAALGIDPLALGMAPAATIYAADSANASSEMLAYGAAYPGEPGKIAISNHSYGYVMGWNGTTWYGNFSDNGSPSDDYDTWFGRYDSTSATYDGILASLPYYLPFWSAGNDRNDDPPAPGQTWYLRNGTPRTYDPAQHPPGDGAYKSGYDLLGSYQACKNVMTVGAVDDAVNAGARDVSQGLLTLFSSTGPSDDGRIKPDIVANGDSLYSADSTSDSSYASMSGTSMASPNAAGSAMLLVDYYAKCFPGSWMRASTLKALIIHTADDLGRPGPDYQTGWGLMNTARAAELIRSRAASVHSQAIHEDALPNGGSRTFTFGWDGVSPIRATLCWTDPPGSGSSSHDNRSADLVNDLNLTITGPDATAYLPFAMAYVHDWTTAKLTANAIRAVNSVDTVEQVLIDAPSLPGLYQVKVSHAGSLANLQPQTFSLIISGLVTVPGEIAVEHPAGTDLADNGPSVSFGEAPVGAAYSPLIFTVKNAGPGDLSGSYFAPNSGLHPGDFIVNPAGISTPVAPGSSATFAVTFRPSGLGERSAILHLVSTDEDESPFDIVVTGTGVEPASVVVGQPAFSTQSLSVSQSTTPGPSGCAISRDGKLAVCDQAARRVLLWDSVPTSNGEPAAVVLGKASFTDTSATLSAATLSNCDGVAFTPDGQKLIVSDSANHRVLIWNAIPSANGTPADVVIGQPHFLSNTTGRTATKLNYPAGLLVTPASPTAPSKLLIADYGNNRVLVFQRIPTSNGAAADLVIGQPSMTAGTPGSGAHQLNQPWDMALAPDGRLLLADLGNNRVLLFGSVPQSSNAPASLVLGQTVFGVSSGGTSASRFLGPIGVDVSPSGQLAISEYGNHRVLVFASVPVTSGAAADRVLGQPDFATSVGLNGGPHAGSLLRPYPPVYANDGRLLIPGRSMRRLMIFGLPAPEIALEQSPGIDLPHDSSLNLGSERIDVLAPSRKVTVRNLGGAPLTNLGLHQTGAHSGDFRITAGDLPSSLPPYAAASFSVAFLPTAPGARTALLQVISNDADEPSLALSLGGTAIPSFGNWAKSRGLQGIPALPSAPAPADGLPNLLHYAFDLDASAPAKPMVPGGHSGLPSILLQASGSTWVLRFEYLRRTGGELLYHPVKSPDLSAATWTSLTSAPVVTPVDALWERVVYEEPITTAPCFGRVEVTLPGEL